MLGAVCAHAYHLQRSCHFAKCFNNKSDDNNFASNSIRSRPNGPKPTVLRCSAAPLCGCVDECSASRCSTRKSICASGRIMLTMAECLCRRLNSFVGSSSHSDVPHALRSKNARHIKTDQIIDINSFLRCHCATSIASYHLPFSSFLYPPHSLVPLSCSLWLVCRLNCIFHWELELQSPLCVVTRLAESQLAICVCSMSLVGVSVCLHQCMEHGHGSQLSMPLEKHIASKEKCMRMMSSGVCLCARGTPD